MKKLPLCSCALSLLLILDFAVLADVSPSRQGSRRRGQLTHTIAAPVAVAGVRGYRIDLNKIDTFKTMGPRPRFSITPDRTPSPFYLPSPGPSPFRPKNTSGCETLSVAAVPPAAARLALRVVELAQSENFQQAEAAARAVDSSAPEWAMTARLLSFLAQTERGAEWKLYDEMFAWTPAAPQWNLWRLLNMAALADRMERPDLAATCLGLILQSNAAAPSTALYGLAISAVESTDYTVAIKALDRVTTADPTNFQATLLLGAVALLQGDADTAAAHLARAIALDPGVAEAHQLMAELHLMKGDPGAARLERETAERLSTGR